MNIEPNQEPSFIRPSSDTLLSMFSDALGFQVTIDTRLTPDQELVGGTIVQSRLDSVSEEMAKMQRGEQADIEKLMDTKAQAALLEIWIERRTQG